jgi:hypothetical protein
MRFRLLGLHACRAMHICRCDLLLLVQQHRLRTTAPACLSACVLFSVHARRSISSLSEGHPPPANEVS